MYYCNNCNRKFKNKKNLYDGLCENCYKAYILEEIEHLDFSENNTQIFSFSEFFSNFFNNIKKYFKKNK